MGGVVDWQIHGIKSNRDGLTPGELIEVIDAGLPMHELEGLRSSPRDDAFYRARMSRVWKDVHDNEWSTASVCAEFH
ncbi:MAG: hypothetical protein ACXW3L_04750 [Limisphaerales bacterium]